MKDYTVKTKSSSFLVKGITALAFPFAAQLTGCSMGQKSGVCSAMMKLAESNKIKIKVKNCLAIAEDFKKSPSWDSLQETNDQKTGYIAYNWVL
ncbi:MAG: hypothetical protein QWI37_04035 [Candidatus Cardinium sp.]|nr:hypothetical protein [Candidatus Cardinium sp.]